ncbi:hypothetical protein N9D46_00725 [Chitinophagales bacterium]|nr:hypothetical protein [Chitinophagales bacterium]
MIHSTLCIYSQGTNEPNIYIYCCLTRTGRMAISILNTLNKQDTTSGKFSFIKMDIDKHTMHAQQFGEQFSPTLMLFQQDDLFWKQYKVAPAHLVMQKILKHA